MGLCQASTVSLSGQACFVHTPAPLIPGTVPSLKQPDYFEANYFHIISLRNKINTSFYTFKHIFRGKKENDNIHTPYKNLVNRIP